LSGTDIFLSYARQDRPTARIFAESLIAEGFRVWWDASLHSGETFDEVIEQRLRDAKAVVVLWSPRSVSSRWVRAEATLADRRNKLAPAIIESCDRPIIFELTHAAELSGWTGDRSDVRWRNFVEDLRRLVDAAAEAEPARVEPRPSPVQEAQQPSRHALRPGSDEVIFADRARAVPPLRQTGPAPAPPPAATLVDADAHSEVHCLEIIDAEFAREPIVIDASGLKIGRSPPADIVVSHKSVSRTHCIVGLANDELLVTDLNSTNGTYIDDVRISRATVLPVGSTLRLGQVSLKHALRSRAESERRGGLGGDNELGAEPIAASR
jgi:hypothetical protein